MFAWWDENRNEPEKEITQEIMLIVMEPVGWLEFNRAYGNVIPDIEMEANNPILQTIIKAHMVESVMEYNLTVPEDRQIAISQNDIQFRQEDNEMDVDLTFYIMKNLKKVNLIIPKL